MKNFFFKLILALLVLPGFSIAQVSTSMQQIKSLQEYKVNERTGFPGYMVFKPEERTQISNFNSWIKNSFKLRQEDNLEKRTSQNDDLGYIHHRYQQTYKNIPIEGGDYIVHEKNGQIISMNGDFYSGIKISNDITINERSAVQFAIKSVGASKYKWENKEEEEEVKEALNDPTFSYSPKSQIVIYPMNGIYKYAYKIDIFSDNPYGRWDVYVDATSGAILDKISKIHTADVLGRAKTKYSDTVSIVTDSISPGLYRLRDYSRGSGVITLNMKRTRNITDTIEFIDNDNFWDNKNVAKDEVATDAHWGAEMTYDFFKNILGRNSYNDQGGKLLSYVHSGFDALNASWNGYFMIYGDGGTVNGETYNPFPGLDVCGHELAHGVTGNSAGLVYRGESGALNESFSDIFGATIEYYSRPTRYNWIIGEDVKSGGLRSMSYPNSHGNPDTYEGTKWTVTLGCTPNGTNDNCGVHNNSGVQNFWYYLLVNGGSGINDKDSAYSVTGIGYEKAAKIAYRNLSVYLTANSNYRDACFYAIKAAEDIYGAGSNEVIQTTNAWFAVGLGQRYSIYPKADFSVEVYKCTLGFNYKFLNNSSGNSDSFVWHFGDGDTSHAKIPNHTYSQLGTYTVKLVATNSFGSDSITKINFIKIHSDFPSNAKCTPSVLDPKVGQGVFNFSMSDISHYTGSSLAEGGYKDFTCQRVHVKADTTYSISVTTADSLSYVRVWIDYNNDTKFTYPTELVFSSNALKVQSGNIEIPNTAIGDVPLRLRVIGAPVIGNKPDSSCFNYVRYGQIEDYSIEISGIQAKADFKIEKDCLLDSTYKFINKSNAASFIWYFGDGDSSLSFSPTHKYNNPGKYLVTLIGKNKSGSDSLTSYLTINNYCPAVVDSLSEHGITKFTLSNVSKSSLSSLPEGRYVDYTCEKIYLKADSSYSVEVNTTDTMLASVRIWIDYDNDGLFSYPAELGFASDNSNIHSGFIKIPKEADTTTVLRIRVIGGLKDSPDSVCYNLQYGQIEDYSAVISPPKKPEVNKIISLKYESNLKIYPNPASDYLRISMEMEGSRSFDISFFNVLGEKVYAEAIHSTNGFNKNINISNLPKGIYFIKLSSVDATLMRKVIIQ